MLMKVADVMTPQLQIITTDTPLMHAAKIMQKHDVGILPVISDEKKVVGMLTDRDIIVRSVIRGDDPRSTRAVSAMTRDVVTCFDDDAVEDAAKKMQAKKVRRMLVLNRKNPGLSGIVSLGDIARADGQKEVAGAVLGKINEAKPEITSHSSGSH